MDCDKKCACCEKRTERPEEEKKKRLMRQAEGKSYL